MNSTDLQFRLFAWCVYWDQLWDFFLLSFLLLLLLCLLLLLFSLYRSFCLLCGLYFVLLCLFLGCGPLNTNELVIGPPPEPG